MRLPGAGAQPDSLTEMLLANNGSPVPATRPRTSSLPGTFAQKSGARPNSRSRTRRRPAQQDRRKIVTVIATGATITGVLAVSGISLAHLIQAPKQPQSSLAGITTTGTTTTTTTPDKGATATPTPGKHNTPTPSQSPTAKPSPTPTSGAQPTQPAPTQPPPPTPKPTQPPGHTGTVIGSTAMATNSSKSFTNPGDGQGSLLIRLSNGNFVACERACTHAGVPVDYDSGSGKLVCPAHNAIFDPANGFNLVSGPGNGPLPTVAIRVNGDGTITTG